MEDRLNPAVSIHPVRKEKVNEASTAVPFQFPNVQPKRNGRGTHQTATGWNIETKKNPWP
jgi:hypothetical protein